MPPTLTPIRSWKERQLTFKTLKTSDKGTRVRLTIGRTASWAEPKQTNIHPHSLHFTVRHGSVCDQCSHQSFGFWHCENQACDYDICGECMQEHLDKYRQKTLTRAYHEDPCNIARRWKEIFSCSEYNQYTYRYADVARLISATEIQVREWVDSGGQTPKNFDHRKLKWLIDKILKRQKVKYEGCDYKPEQIAFDPDFERPNLPTELSEEEPETIPTVSPSAATAEIEKESDVAMSEPEEEEIEEEEIFVPPPKKRKRKADVSKKKQKSKKRNVGASKSTKQIDWKQDPESVAEDLYKAGWGVKISEFGDKKILHFVERT